MVKTRNKGLDIAKGIGIILVVLGHACSPASLFTAQFHMPLFFVISGYLFDGRNSVKDFIKRKINSLYLPFIIWNILFIGLTVLKNILTSTPTLGYAVKSVIKTLLTLDKHVHLGATWFLGALFVMSILYKLCDTYINPKKYKRLLITLFFYRTCRVWLCCRPSVFPQSHSYPRNVLCLWLCGEGKQRKAFAV